jgi:hypothetical protein
MAETRRSDATAWATIGGGLIALGAVLWGIGLRFSPPRSATVASSAWWDAILASGWFLAAMATVGAGALAVVGSGVALLLSRRTRPAYVTMTEPYEDGAHYIVLARRDGEDLGYAVPRVSHRRGLLPDHNYGEPQTLKRGEQVKYCFPNHFPDALAQPNVGTYKVRWSVAEHAEPALRRGRASRTVKTLRFKISEDDRAARSSLFSEDEKPEKPNAPRDPSKVYSATPKHEVGGQGRFRYVKATLHDVGNGYDHGVLCEITVPGGRSYRAAWNGLDTPMSRRIVASDGHGVYAPVEGEYRIRWWNTVPPDYSPEVIAEEVVSLPPTGPLEGWRARHDQLTEDELILGVERINPSHDLLSGFRCLVRGPHDFWEADDRSLQENWFDPPAPKGQGLFSFPKDFGDAPKLEDLRDGDYQVEWTAWKLEEGRTAESLDVAHDTFRVDRDGTIE